MFLRLARIMPCYLLLHSNVKSYTLLQYVSLALLLVAKIFSDRLDLARLCCLFIKLIANDFGESFYLSD